MLHTHSRRSLPSLTWEGHSSSCLRSSRVPSPEPLAAHRKLQNCLPRLSALFATRQDLSTPRETFQVPLRSAPRLSQPLGGFLQTSTPQAYFILQPRPGFPLPSKDFPLRTADVPHRKIFAPMLLPHLHSKRPSTAFRSNWVNFEALLHTKVRSLPLGFSQSLRRFLLRVHAPPGFRATASESSFTRFIRS